MSFFRRKKKKTRTGAEKAARYRRWPRRLKFYREGFWLIFMVFGLGIAAINTGHNLLYLLLGFLLAIISLSGVFSERVLKHARADFVSPGPVHAGEAQRVAALVHNNRKWGRIYSVRSFPLLDDNVVEVVPAYAPELQAGEQGNHLLRLRFARRGVYRSEWAQLETDFPFGLVCKSRVLRSDAVFRVWPRVFDLELTHPSAFQRAEEQSGARVSPVGEEFYGVRDYRPGDPQHRIHWRLTARRQKPIVRELELPRSPQLIVTCRIPALGDLEKEDRYAEVAASVALKALDMGYAVGLDCRQGNIPPGRGSNQAVRILDMLTVEPAEGPASQADLSIRVWDASGRPVSIEVGGGGWDETIARVA